MSELSPRTAVDAGLARARMRARLKGAWHMAHRWKGRVLYAFADQGLYSVTNFLLTVFYASWLPLDTFGRYVVVWTVSLFIEAIQTSLIVDSLPAIVSRYGRRSARHRNRLDAAGFWVVIAFSALTSLLLLVAAVVIGLWRPVYVGALVALAVANPLQRLYLLCRRLAYIRDRQEVAAAMAACYGVISVGGAYVLFRLDALSLPGVIALWAVGSLAGVIMAFACGIGRPRATRPANVIWLASEIWRSGRWLSGAAVATWISNWAIFPIVAATTGAGTAGIIRALQNLLTPIVQFNAALHLAVLPRVADKIADQGVHYGRWFARRATVVFAAIAAAYCAVILAAAPFILPHLYKKPEIAAGAYLLWPLAIAIVLEALRQASAISLLAKQHTRIVFVARWIALAVFAVSSLVLGLLIGFQGILWGTVAASATGAAIVLATALSEQSEIH